LIREALWGYVVIAALRTNGIISVSHGVEPRMVNLPRCAGHSALA
jgi:hypothetical protein